MHSFPSRVVYGYYKQKNCCSYIKTSNNYNKHTNAQFLPHVSFCYQVRLETNSSLQSLVSWCPATLCLDLNKTKMMNAQKKDTWPWDPLRKTIRLTIVIMNKEQRIGDVEVCCLELLHSSSPVQLIWQFGSLASWCLIDYYNCFCLWLLKFDFDNRPKAMAMLELTVLLHSRQGAKFVWKISFVLIVITKWVCCFASKWTHNFASFSEHTVLLRSWQGPKFV